MEIVVMQKMLSAQFNWCGENGKTTRSHQQTLLGELHVLDIHELGAQLREKRRVLCNQPGGARHRLDQVRQASRGNHHELGIVLASQQRKERIDELGVTKVAEIVLGTHCQHFAQLGCRAQCGRLVLERPRTNDASIP